MRRSTLCATFLIPLSIAVFAAASTGLALAYENYDCVEYDEKESCVDWEGGGHPYSLIAVGATWIAASVCCITGAIGGVLSCSYEDTREEAEKVAGPVEGCYCVDIGSDYACGYAPFQEWLNSPVTWPTCIADRSTSDIENQSSTQVEMVEISTESKESKDSSESTSSQKMGSTAASTGFFKTSTPERDDSSDEDDKVVSLTR